MKDQPVVVKIALAYLPAAVLIIILGRMPWWANILVALASLAATVMLWVFLFDREQKPAVKEGIDPALLNEELKEMLIDTSAAGSTLHFSARSLEKRIEELRRSLEEISSSLQELAGADRYAETALEKIRARLSDLEAHAGEVIGAGDTYLEYTRTVESLAGESRRVLEQTAEMNAENSAAVEGASGAMEELDQFDQKIKSVIKTIRAFGKQANTLALNTSIKTSQSESVDKGLAVVAEEVSDLANYACRGVDKITALADETDSLIGSLREKLEMAAGAVSLQDMQINLLKESLEKMIPAAGETVQRFSPVGESCVSLKNEVSEAAEEAGSVAGTVQNAAAALAIIKGATAEQEWHLDGIRGSVSAVAERVEELRQKAGRYDLPLLGYLDQPAGKAGAYLFKHWYRRDCGGEVILVGIEDKATVEMYDAMAEGLFDASISCRTPGDCEELVKSYGDRLDMLGTNLAGPRRGLLVPEYVNIGTIGVLRHNKEAFGGVIYSMAEHAQISRQAREAVEEYSAEMELVYGDLDRISGELDRAISEKRWVVVTGWTPEPRFDHYQLKFLTDPKRCFGGEQFIKTVTRKGLKEEIPHYQRALQRFRWGLEEVSLFMKKVSEGSDYDQAAREILSGIEFTLL